MLDLLWVWRVCRQSKARCIPDTERRCANLVLSPDMGAPKPSDEILEHGTARDCKEPMGWTSENVANDFGVTREEMDQWAAT